jgi:acyl-coenzyme A thioesterase PaaI-like protein
MTSAVWSGQPAMTPDPHPASPHYPAFAGCYGCGPDCPGGLGVCVSVGAPARFTVLAVHQGAPGRAHGGVLAALLDEVIGITVWSLGKTYATARLEVDYVMPVPVGASLHVAAVCTGIDGRKVHAEARARLGAADGPIAVRAAALYVELPQAR